MKRCLFYFIGVAFFLWTVPGACSGTLEIYRLLNLFGDVFSRVRTEYVETVDDKKLIENALNGMLSALDPHSSYMNEKEFQDLMDMTKGEFGGLGVEVLPEHGVIKIISPLDDTPAFRAGIQPGDYFIEIDGQPISGMTVNESIEKMRGKPGTTVKLKVFREGKEPFVVEMTREMIKVKPIRWRVIENVGIIRITTFIDESTGEKLLAAIKEIKASLGNKLEGIVLDIRNNAGGLLEQAISVSDLFLDEKEVVSIKGRKEGDEKKFYTRAGEDAKGIPVVVLINNGSASCPEIVAGALQDHKRAIILGTRSWGKGSVQTVIPLAEYGALRLTTNLYYTPKGRSIQAEGIIPDIEVHQSEIKEIESQDALREENIPGALKSAISKSKKPQESITDPKKDKNEDQKTTPELEKKKELSSQETSSSPSLSYQEEALASAVNGIKDPAFDYQLRRALDLLHGLLMMKVIKDV